MTEITQLQGQLQVLTQQRNEALDRATALGGQLLVALQELEELKKPAEPKKEAEAPQLEKVAGKK